MESHIQVTHDQQQNRHILVFGALDAELSGKLEKALSAGNNPDSNNISIDLANVSFMTADAVRVFLNARIHAAGNTRIELLNPNTEVRELLVMVGLDSLLGGQATQ